MLNDDILNDFIDGDKNNNSSYSQTDDTYKTFENINNSFQSATSNFNQSSTSNFTQPNYNQVNYNNKTFENNNDIGKRKLEEIKQKLNNNVYYSFGKSLWNKYKIIIIFIIIVIIIAFIEVYIASCVSDCTYRLVKNKILKIQPPCVNLEEDEYIYVYNTMIFEKKDVMDKCKIPEHYKKKTILEHISTHLSRPIKGIYEGFKNSMTSCTPINNITNGLINCCKLKEASNPLNSFNSISSNWSIIYPPDRKIKCFVTKDKIMFNN